MNETAAKPAGLRERKRVETRRRILDVGLKLFVAKGYEATTLDDIAEAAGISRRTFFSYFDSKDEILTAYVDGFVSELKDLVGECASLGTPLEVVAAALSKLVALRESEIVTTARIMRESAGLRARNQGKFLRLEQAIFDGLCEVWPDDAKRDRWRFTAMMSAGTLRFAVEAWGRQNGKPPLAVQIQNMFQKLQDAIRENL
ncbi:MAG: TetR family transcriptional regulator [Rhizobiales bacterium]|nr:TetR family transcriptional regulator [Hyphomicrobiales bacterium]